MMIPPPNDSLLILKFRTYRGNKRIIGFGNNRFLSGKPYTKEEKTVNIIF